MQQSKRYGKITDVAAYLGISRGMAYRLARSNDVWRVAYISPRCIRVDLDSVDEWLAERSRGQDGGR